MVGPTGRFPDEGIETRAAARSTSSGPRPTGRFPDEGIETTPA